MPSFDSYLQPASSTPPPVMVNAPIVVDATSPKGLRPLLTFINSLECNSNIAVAAAEGERLGPYFNMMSGYLANVLDSSSRTPKDKAKTKELIKPENLAGLFNAAAERTKNTLTSDVAVLPSNIIQEGPAAHFFRDEQQFDAPYEYNGHTFNFGFLQVFEGGRKVARSSTTFPTFLLDEKMIDAAMPYGIQSALKNFQSVMSTVNHDMLHHFTSTIVHPAVAHKFPGVPEAKDTAMGKWGARIDESDPDPDNGGEFYEAWSKLGHANALLSPDSRAATEELFGQVTRYFDDLKRIGAQIVQEEGETDAARARGHDVVDYFGTVMAHALSRAFHLNHPLMFHCIQRMQEADPAPGLVSAECLQMMTYKDVPPSRIPDAIREAVPLIPGMADIVKSYQRSGLDILSEKGAPLDYLSLKLLQLIKVSREDVDPSVPSPLSKRMKQLQKVAGSLTLEMFDAAAKSFDFQVEPLAGVRKKPLQLSSLVRKDFNHASDPDGNLVFALSNADTAAKDIPGEFELTPVAEVLSLLSQPGFTDSSIDTLVTEDMRFHLREAEKEDPEHRDIFEILNGHSPLGISLHMVAAEGADGKPAILYVIEDRPLKKCLVIGDSSIPSRFSAELKDKGLTYVTKSASGAAGAVDAFLHESAHVSGRRPDTLTQYMMLALSVVCEIPGQFLMSDRMVRGDVRMGQVLTTVRDEPTLYTSVVRLRQQKL